jgi:hypothetical protein
VTVIRPYDLPLEWLSSRASNPQELLRRYRDRRALVELIVSMQAGDEIRKFDSPRKAWRAKCGRHAYALVRKGKPVARVVLLLN